MKNYLNFNREKGITLIALVITIIVLLILAGVSIAMLTGQNGILTQAEKARKETQIANEKEKIGVAYATANMKSNIDKIGLTKELFQQELDNQFGEGKTTVEASKNNKWLVTVEENKYLIDKKTGIIEYVENDADIETVIDDEPGILEQLGNNTYEINSIEDLVAFSYNVNSSTEVYKGKKVVLGRSFDFNNDKHYVNPNAKYTKIKDIGYKKDDQSGTTIKELLTTGEGFIPVGAYYGTFRGVFDGKGYELSNIYIDILSAKGVGFFGEIEAETEISNFGIKSGTLTGQLCGGIIGRISPDGKVKISNCYNMAEIHGLDGIIGGLVGRSSGSGEIVIEDSYNLGNINGTTSVKAGGLIGHSEEKSIIIKKSYNKGNVSGFHASGIVPVVTTNDQSEENMNKMYIESCYNEGNVTSEAPAAGIVSSGTLKEIKNCYNTGTIKSTRAYASGIIASLDEIDSILITDCYNTGSIQAEVDSYPSGGIVGEAKNSIITSSYNLGKISSSSSKVGGIVGQGGTVSNCYYLEGTADKEVGDSSGIGNRKTKAEMQTDTFLNLLKAGNSNSLWIRDVNKNEGIPILKWPI